MKPTPSLPVRDGVSPSLVWLPDGRWKTVGEFFAERFAHVSASSWQARMARGEVRDERGMALHTDSPYRTGACVFYYRELPQETPIPFDEIILYQDAQILVVDKPHFLPVTPGGRFVTQSLLVRLKQKTGIHSLVPIHRLDRETAGVMLFSVDPGTRNQWQALFRDRAVVKVYEALAGFRDDLCFPMTVQNRLVQDTQFFRMREEAGLPNASTYIEFMRRSGAHALYRLFPETGKMHQLRVHLSGLGLPIVNDIFYPVALPCKGDDFSAPLKLLARSLSFRDPINGLQRVFESDRQL